ncbi:MAG: RNA-binding S4 domain-containing protein [Bacteroidales bacterium]|nr:RNA-binding S4 domain-containing protein [Bacteroidales bacterium]
MRIDKYLWVVRLFKTRSQAAEACRNGRVFIHEEAVKAAREIKTGEVFDVKQHGVKFTYQAVGVPPSRVGAALVPQYLSDLTPAEEKAKLTAQRSVSAFEYRERGAGRPTKKERREIDRYKEEDIFED